MSCSCTRGIGGIHPATSGTVFMALLGRSQPRRQSGSNQGRLAERAFIHTSGSFRQSAVSTYMADVGFSNTRRIANPRYSRLSVCAAWIGAAPARLSVVHTCPTCFEFVQSPSGRAQQSADRNRQRPFAGRAGRRRRWCCPRPRRRSAAGRDVSFAKSACRQNGI